MLTVNAAIHGWSPSGDDDIEVNVSQDMCFMTIGPIASSTSFLSPICPPLDTTPPKPRFLSSHSTPSNSLSSVTRTAIAPSSDRRAQRNRNRDPSWIPRPRNAFIIFRCEYSREHAQGAQESQNDQDSNNASIKTLSKRAAEAWKQLPPPERERYKILADKEREEHARLYPHYRFRPMKRQMSGAGAGTRNSCERSQSPKETSMESRPALSTHIPSVLGAAPEKPRLNPPAGRIEASPPIPQAVAPPLLEPLLCPPEVSVSMDCRDHVLFYPSPEPALSPNSSSSPSGPFGLYSPLHISQVGISPDSFRCDDSAFGLDPTAEDLEQTQALEAYAIGLYNHDLFSSFPFPEYC